MKKPLKYLVPVSMVGGGMVLGSIFSPLALSGAEEGADTSETTVSDTTEQTDDGDNTSNSDKTSLGARVGRRHIISVLTDLGITQENLSAGKASGQTLLEIAADAGVSEDDLVEAIHAASSERIATALENGKIDEERAAEFEAALDERIEARINKVYEGHEGRSGHGRTGTFTGKGQIVDSLADLGIDSQTLKDGKAAGKTLVEIAAEAGVSEADLVDALVESAQEKLAAVAENGNIDADKLSELSDKIEQRIEGLVNGEISMGRGGFGGHGNGGSGSSADKSDT